MGQCVWILTRIHLVLILIVLILVPVSVLELKNGHTHTDIQDIIKVLWIKHHSGSALNQLVFLSTSSPEQLQYKNYAQLTI